MKKIKFSASERNKDAILSALKTIISATTNGSAIEIASGTGQHVSLFASYFTKWTWQPTDIEPRFINSINAYKEETKLTNILPPIIADISKGYTTWDAKLKENSYDLMFNANMVHISPVMCTHGLFQTAGVLLKHGGKLVTYGPYSIDGVLSPQSNIDFDRSLKAQNPEWGVKDTGFLKKLAHEELLELVQVIDMPSNNKCLVFQKR